MTRETTKHDSPSGESRNATPGARRPLRGTAVGAEPEGSRDLPPRGAPVWADTLGSREPGERKDDTLEGLDDEE